MGYKVLVIRPGEAPVLEMNETGLAGLQQLVGGDVQCLPINDDPDIAGWVNEDGIAKGLPRNQFATDLCSYFQVGLDPADYIKGTMVFCEINDEGESVDVPESFVEAVMRQVEQKTLTAKVAAATRVWAAEPVELPYGIDALNSRSPRQVALQAIEDLPDVSPQAVAEEILETVTRVLGKAPYTGGCDPAFQTASAWREKGNIVSDKTMFVVVHDGGDFAPFFNPAYEDKAALQSVADALEELGCSSRRVSPVWTEIYYVT